jgi:predicted AAA+ superfamily ATPase
MNSTKRLLFCPERSFFLFGPRGTGKSTWLRMQMPEALFVDLLSPEICQRFTASPDRLRDLVAGNADRHTIVLDEIQRVPALLSVVHQLIEAHPGLRFVLTGSSSRKLKRAGVDMLAGRALLTTCHPFMAAELGKAFSLENALRVGMVPLVLAAEDCEAVLRAYLALYVREEVQMEGLVRNMGSFARFLEAISFSHAALLSVAEVARECAVSRTTVEGYVSILEDLLIAVRLPVFAKRAKRQLVGHSKFYFFDAGVFRSARPKGPLDRPQEIDGAALEGLIFQHLRAWNDYSGQRHTLHFWRTRAGAEVDFVVYGEKEVAAIEVKNADKISSRDLQALKAFAADYPEARTVLLYRGQEQFLRDGVLCVPCERFLTALRPGQPLPDMAWR